MCEGRAISEMRYMRTRIYQTVIVSQTYGESRGGKTPQVSKVSGIVQHSGKSL